MTESDLVVAIDGPVGVGKSTVAREVAARLGLHHLDTGAMYRAVALEAMRRFGDNSPDDEGLREIAATLQLELLPGGKVLLGGEDVTLAIRDEEVSRYVTHVADSRIVRQALVEEQQRIGRLRPSLVEGRDIGTVVFPNAACKIYLDGTPFERARRREDQLRRLNKTTDKRDVFRALLERDERDRMRPWGALRLAPDAIVLDTTRYDLQTVVAIICSLVHANELFAGHQREAHASTTGGR